MQAHFPRLAVDLGADVTRGQLRDEGYGAFFMAIGSQECKLLGIENEELDGVWPGVDYLLRTNLGEQIDLRTFHGSGASVAVLEKAETAAPGVGALRLRLVAHKPEAAPFALKDEAGKYLPGVLLDLDYWALVPL